MPTFSFEHIGNWGFIKPIPKGKLANGLLKYMSYKKQGIEFMPNPLWGICKLYNQKSGKFPWGLKNVAINVLIKWCELNPTDSFSLPEVKPINGSFEISDSLREYQKEAIKKLILYNGGIICMPCGGGKTKTIIEYLKIMNKQAVVVVPSLDIKTQWEKQVKELQFIRIINFQNKLVIDFIKNSEIVVYDECHRVAAKTVYKYAMKTNNNTILIGASATPKREDGEDMKIIAALGEIVYTITRRELIEEGFLSDAKVYYHRPIFDLREDFKLD